MPRSARCLEESSSYLLVAPTTQCGAVVNGERLVTVVIGVDALVTAVGDGWDYDSGICNGSLNGGMSPT